MGVDAQNVTLRLETPIGKPDKQDTDLWLGYKFGDILASFDIDLNAESKTAIVYGISMLHNTGVVSKNKNPAEGELLYPQFMDIVQAGADAAGGVRLEVAYDLHAHRAQYGSGPNVAARMKNRYGLDVPIWKRKEDLRIPVQFLREVDFDSLFAKINREQGRLAQAVEMYGKPGTLYVEKVEPTTHAVEATYDPKGLVFTIPEGAYVPRVRDNRDFTLFVDVNGDGKDDIDHGFALGPGQMRIRVHNQYTGPRPLSPAVRRQVEGGDRVYVLNITPTPPLAPPAPATPPTPAAPPSGAAPTGIGTAPPAPTPVIPFYAARNAEAEGIITPLRPNIHAAVTPGYASLSLTDRFSAQGIEADANASGFGIAGNVGVVTSRGDALAVDVDGSYFTAGNGTGVVAQGGKNLGAFMYEGAHSTIALALGYLRELGEQQTDSDITVKSLRVGGAVSRDSARISGSALTANEQQMMRMLATLGFDYARASVAGADYNVQLCGGAGVNKETNTNGIEYDAGVSGKLDAALRVRFTEIGIAAGIGGTYDQMSAGVQKTREERDSISLAGTVRGMYFLDEQRLNSLGIGVAHTTTIGETSNARKTQLEETQRDTRLLITLDLMFH